MGPQFNMTALAMRTATGINAVSQLHGNVTRKMWTSIWPGTAAEALPIKAITNGVHVSTWVSSVLGRLFDEHLGTDWRERLDEPEFWDRVLDIPDEDLWRARRSMRGELFAFIQDRARERWTTDKVSAAQVVAAGTLLDFSALTIGFARRFAGYKRPDLIFHDPARLAAILNAPRRPVQIVFAGKAHPADDVGKHHLQQVYRRAADPAFGGRIAFIDDYDLHVAHYLVHGCDVWLNNPRKPNEASGTSGMKAAINGIPHLSVGDGWWAEGFNGANGWLIDGHASEADHGQSDAADAEALYTILEEEVVPAFYDRDARDVPKAWLRIVKEAIRSIMPEFSTRRMMKQYAERDVHPRHRLDDAGRPRRLNGDTNSDTFQFPVLVGQDGNWNVSLFADGRVVHDLDAVAVRVAEVEGPRAVPVRSRPGVESHLPLVQERRPGIHVLRRPHDEPQVVERLRPIRSGMLGTLRLVQREVVRA